MIPAEGIPIRAASPADHDAIWTILEPVIRAGETMALDRFMTRAQGLAYWCQTSHAVCVAELPGEGIRGTYYLRANQAGGGAHVANAGYATHPDATGRGIARAMARHSLDQARARGFRAMQFNFVVATNDRAIRLWHGVGMREIGRLPDAFDHPVHGLTDALVMHRALDPRAPDAPAP